MNLSDLEKTIASAIFSAQPNNDITQAAAVVQAHGVLSAEQRVGIYRNSVHGILCQHLGAIFNVTKQLIGEERFTYVCDGFIDQSPPSNPHLANYGEAFIPFLKSHPALENNRWIAEVATLEWARHSAWHAINQPVSDFSALAVMDQDKQASLQFHLPKSAHLLSLSVAADDVWLAHQSADLEQITSILSSIKLTEDRHLMIWRRGRTLEQVRPSPVQHAFLNHASNGASLNDLADTFGEDVGDLLSTSVSNGWLVSFS